MKAPLTTGPFLRPKTGGRKVNGQTITTLDDLEALPAGSVFRDDFGRLWEWEHVGFGGVEKALSAMGIGSMLAPHGFRGFPATVLHVPDSAT